MIFLAGFVLKGPLQAALVVAAMAILGLLLPPVSWISAAAIVLVTLVNGYKQGLITTAISAVGAAVFAYIIFANIKGGTDFTPLIALKMVFYFVLLIWLPAWIAATALQQTVSLAFTMQLLTVVSLVAVAIFYLLYPNFGEHWRNFLNELSSQVLAVQSDAATVSALKSLEEGLIKLLPGLFVSSLMLGTMFSLFLGRWWQAIYFNPGGFGKEFRALALGKFTAIVALVILALTVVLKTYVMAAFSIIVMILYSVQGTAILHAIFKIRKTHVVWLILIYGLMMFVPQLMVVVLFVGMIDSWVDIRQRLTPVA